MPVAERWLVPHGRALTCGQDLHPFIDQILDDWAMDITEGSVRALTARHDSDDRSRSGRLVSSVHPLRDGSSVAGVLGK